MTRFGNEVLAAARARVGEPFRHHFKPDNECDDGQMTTESCMNRGMDNDGYDCSGLAIVSVCEVLNVGTERWPQDLRHLNQMAMRLRMTCDPIAGDLVIYRSLESRSLHAGIFATGQTVVHASGRSKEVEESVVQGAEPMLVIPPSVLAAQIQR